MPKQALGLIEVVGMPAAIEAADTAVKAANVNLIGYEKTKGGGMILVKFEGDVGAVKAALDAASIAASKVNRVVSKHMIPRPSDELEKIMSQKDQKVNVEMEQDDASGEQEELSSSDDEDDLSEQVPEKDPLEEQDPSSEFQQGASDPEPMREISEILFHEETVNNEQALDNPPLAVEIEPEKELCNICKDPLCTRRKGEARAMCIHYQAVGGK